MAFSFSSGTTRIDHLMLRLETYPQDGGTRPSGDVSDYTGRKISGSAILRALLRYTNQQGYQWFLSQVSPFIEAEISSGVVWGKKK
jgi:hypothetical protein